MIKYAIQELLYQQQGVCTDIIRSQFLGMLCRLNYNILSLNRTKREKKRN